MWTIDCRKIYELVKSAYPSLDGRYADADLASVSARNVVFPIQKTSTQNVLRGNSAVAMPGYDDALENTRITFIQNAATDTDPQAAKVYNLLFLWHQIMRQGRDEINTFDFKTSGIISASDLIPKYRCDIDVSFVSNYDTGMTEDGDATGHADIYSTYRIKNAWISGLQLDSLDQDGSKFLLATADIPAEDIIPL
jgi:hypothetical protein